MSHAIRAQVMPRPVSTLFGFIAGFVDVCAYFALYGIFVAQLTGSFALAGARMVSGQQELMTVSAIPAFFLAGLGTTVLALMCAPSGRALAAVLALECALITALFVLMRMDAPLERDAPAFVVAALLGIAAMGVQSAAVRLFMKGAPSTNVMTTNTTQLAVDSAILALAACGRGDGAQTREARERFAAYWPPMAGFVFGTALGTVGFKLWGVAAFAVPMLGAYALLCWSLTRPAARTA